MFLITNLVAHNWRWSDIEVHNHIIKDYTPYSKNSSFKSKKVSILLTSITLSTYICILVNANIMRITNYTNLRNNLKSYLDGVMNDSEPLIIHRSGNKSVVVISLEEYNSIKETEYIMESPVMMDIIQKGDEEIKNSGGISVDIKNL